MATRQSEAGAPEWAYERFLQGESVDRSVRPAILRAWRRWQAEGVPWEKLGFGEPVAIDPDSFLIRMARPVFERAHPIVANADAALLLVDADGILQLRYLSDEQMRHLFDRVNAVIGVSYSESLLGPTGTGTALRERRPFRVSAFEHLTPAVQPLTATGVPIFDPLTGRVQGAVGIVCYNEHENLAMAVLAQKVAMGVERRMLEAAGARERALLAAFLRAGDLPDRLAPGGAGLRDLTLGDRRLLEEKAAELIAYGHRAAIEVPLSGERVAVLRSVPITEPADAVGVLAQVRVAGGPWEPLTDEAAPTLPEPFRGPPLLAPADVQARAAEVRAKTAELRAMAADARARAADIQATPKDEPAGTQAMPADAQAGRQKIQAGAQAATADLRAGEADTQAGATDAQARTADTQAGATDDRGRTAGTGATTADGQAGTADATAIRAGAADEERRVTPSSEALARQPAEAAEDPWLLLFGEPGVGRLAIAIRRRMRVLYEAATHMGRTLDVVRTAEELAEATVERFADAVAVDLHEPVLHGDEPGEPDTGEGLRRVAARAVREELFPTGLGQPIRYPPSCPQLACVRTQEAVPWPDPESGPPPAECAAGATAGGARARSVVAAPLLTHDTVLGVATFIRARESEPFDDDDVTLAQELAARAAVCVDNARRFTRERIMATALQRSLLPRRLPEQSAVEVAHRYVPAPDRTGGAWFDVICLSGARVALVVGDVAGRGLSGVATMGRLRTAIGNFAALDMPPAEILAQLDDLARALAREETEAADQEDALLRDVHGTAGATGTTCVYAVYNPITRRCTVASAGHPPPAIVAPDGEPHYLDLPPGQPLGLGGPPFESVEVELPESSKLVLYTRGLLADAPDTASERLLRALDHADGTASRTCAAALSAVPPGRLTDDVAVLVGRTRVLSPDHVAQWDLPADPTVVARVRADVARRLADWNLEHLTFTTELILSELVTNAVRYGAEPIQARLILDRTLICEVADASETSPRPRRATTTDEGGRGLFLVAQLSERWGTRYTRRGKIIWAEQPLTGPTGSLDEPLLAFAADEL